MTKICLINPPTTAFDSKDIYFPMGLISLGTVLENNGIDFDIIDFDLELKDNPLLSKWNAFKNYALQKLAKSNSQIFGISSICSNYPYTLLLAKEIKRQWPNSRIILGGPQPSSVPEETLKACPWIDVISIGEGEQTLLELMRSAWDFDALKGIPGIAFRLGYQMQKNAPRKLIDNLDDLPFPRFELVPIHKYLTISPLIPLIEAGRGCPFLCSFCSTSLMWERQFRVKSPKRILEEMRALNKDIGLTGFGLTHDNFTTSHRYVEQFSEFFQKNNTEGFTWSSSARPDTLNSHRIHSLYKAGCRGFFFGIDSGSDATQSAIDKHLNISQFRNILHESISLGISSITSFILGLPTETKEDIDQTIRLALDSKLMGAVNVPLHRLSPLAGTSLEKANRAQLLWEKFPSDISLSPFDDEEIDEFIKSDRLLFSSFYSISTPYLSLNMPVFAVFYYEMINKIPMVLKELLDQNLFSPCDLFKKWDEWRNNNYRERIINDSFIINTLGEFIGSLLSSGVVSSTKRCQKIADVAAI